MAGGKVGLDAKKKSGEKLLFEVDVNLIYEFGS